MMLVGAPPHTHTHNLLSERAPRAHHYLYSTWGIQAATMTEKTTSCFYFLLNKQLAYDPTQIKL